jgi:drug/metabolite transporter (DMT)-like permease
VALPYAGQLAALGTASCWACSSLAFEAAGRRVGALSLNVVRLALAFAFLSATAFLLRGRPLPVDASAHAWVWLGISGLIGFTFGDFCLFKAFVLVGPRLSMLMMALAPPLAAVLGWLLLGERLDRLDFAGMALTVAGISWAVLERTSHGPAHGPAGAPAAVGALPEGDPAAGPSRTARAARAAGIAYGFGGALGQAGGLVLSKVGMGVGAGAYHPVAATQVRVLVGFLGFAVVASAVGWWPRVAGALRDLPALGWAALGAFFGPFVGVTLSLVAVQHTLAGVAASLMATTPVLIIPLVVLLRRERVGFGGVAGAALAVAGVALLFL